MRSAPLVFFLFWVRLWVRAVEPPQDLRRYKQKMAQRAARGQNGTTGHVDRKGSVYGTRASRSATGMPEEDWPPSRSVSSSYR